MPWRQKNETWNGSWRYCKNWFKNIIDIFVASFDEKSSLFYEGRITLINFLRYILVVFIYGANTVSADVDLLYCIELALQDNSEIKKARAEFSAFKELEDQSLANLLPSVGLSISRSKVNQDRSDGVGASLNQKYLWKVMLSHFVNRFIDQNS